ncbi:class I adenylate-forming enzyme family protein [Roseovarius nitratireducens]|uniref:class I adenylate-forming enzyme family protein n=1 Tax=Roseovarius nitratireducens TaxID=2044597 RepID=UPI000CE1EA4C|nr:class I adenylate-forming enzyme family protein [Roseovarius nitratireducens]
MSARLLSLQDVSAARKFHADGHWQHWTMYDRLCHWARAQPNALALEDSAGTFSYGDLIAWVDGLTATLGEAALRPGDRVAVWAPSRMESVVTLLATSRMGCVCVPSLHRDHNADDILDILDRTSARALVVERGYGQVPEGRDFIAEAKRLPSMRLVLSLDQLVLDAGPDMLRFGGAVSPRSCATTPADDPDRISYLAFTSGTTSRPKGVLHSDNTLLSNGRAIVADFGFDTRTVVYTFSPMSHNMGTVSLAVTLSCGGRLVLHGPLDARRALDRVTATGATYLVGVPTHGLDLVEQLAPGEPLGKARVFQLAGAPVPMRLAKALLDRGIRVQNCYGMTENCSFLYTRADDPIDVVTTTCGHCCAGMELAVFDSEDSDCPLPEGSTGELGVRGASQMLGYFDDQAMTEQALNAAGWFMTGDLGMIDASGNVHVTGRKKDMVIRGGKNIHPARAEELAMRHRAVWKAAAFPVPDDRLGERMCLAVIPRPGTTPPSPQDLLAHLAEHGLPKSQMPEYHLDMSRFPMTASGKILKRSLTSEVAAGRLVPTLVKWSGG